MKIQEILLENELDEMALPSDWDETAFGHDKAFYKRINYARERAKRLGAGSSRVAFMIPDNGKDTVIKVAKNKRGVMQNVAELEILNDGYLGKQDIVIPLIDYDKKNPHPTWIQTEKAEKVRKKQLTELLGCNELFDLYSAVMDVVGKRQKWMKSYKQVIQQLEEAKKSEADIERFKDYVDQVADLVNSSTLDPVDFENPANWGLYQGRPVIIDLGFNEDVKFMYYG